MGDYLGLGVVTKTFPLPLITQLLAETERTSQRERELPAHVMVYYVIALALYMQVSYREVLRALLEGLRWLTGPDATVHPAGPSGISQARTRLGVAPVRRLYEEVVAPIATAATPGAWYRAHRIVSLDGTTLDVADSQANAAAFGRPSSSRGANATGAFPQLRLVALVENGTHVVFGAVLGAYAESEATLARAVLPALRPGMLCLADRYFLGFDLWQQAAATGAALVWRAKANQRFPVEERYADGSYRSALRANKHCRAKDHTPIPVRVIEYRLPGIPDAEPSYRVVTTLLDPATAPAADLAALYHERWEIETAFDELKTPLRGARIVLRSKTPELVRQEA
ncbi:MAG: IS4 family transposase, partial [Anaerolinea sp.]|nr:IS4 family transposase [Anaerolinea sp.]